MIDKYPNSDEKYPRTEYRGWMSLHCQKLSHHSCIAPSQCACRCHDDAAQLEDERQIRDHLADGER